MERKSAAHNDVRESCAETTSLREQQEYTASGLGFLLHPLILESLVGEANRAENNHIRIGEIACGSGLWLLDTAQHLSSELGITATFDGFDHTSQLFPRHAPPYVRFRCLDVVSENIVPIEFAAKFDVVVLRFLHLSLESEQWDCLLRNISLLLKPGGFVQWVDWDPLTARIAAFRPDGNDAVLRAVFQQFTETLRARKVGSTYRITNSMAAVGLEAIDSDLYPLPPRVEFTQALGKEAISMLVQIGEMTSDQGNKMMKEFKDEVENAGSLVWYDRWCHVGRKSGP